MSGMKRKASGRRSGFTLAELLCVFAAASAIFAASALSIASPEARERRIIAYEASDFCAWMKHRISSAAREGAEFELYFSKVGASGSVITLIWLSGSKYMMHEDYRMERAELSREGTSYRYTFDGRWFSMTPAATFVVKSLKRPEVKLFVTLSGTGYMSVRERL